MRCAISCRMIKCRLYPYKTAKICWLRLRVKRARCCGRITVMTKPCRERADTLRLTNWCLIRMMRNVANIFSCIQRAWKRCCTTLYSGHRRIPNTFIMICSYGQPVLHWRRCCFWYWYWYFQRAESVTYGIYPVWLTKFRRGICIHRLIKRGMTSWRRLRKALTICSITLIKWWKKKGRMSGKTESWLRIFPMILKHRWPLLQGILMWLSAENMKMNPSGIYI